MTISNRNDLRKLSITTSMEGEILDAVTKKGTGLYVGDCSRVISADKNNLFVVDNKIIGRCDIKGDNYSACKACVTAFNKSASTEQSTSTKYSFDDVYHADTGGYYSVI